MNIIVIGPGTINHGEIGVMWIPTERYHFSTGAPQCKHLPPNQGDFLPAKCLDLEDWIFQNCRVVFMEGADSTERLAWASIFHLPLKYSPGWWRLEHGFYFSIYWECHHPNWLFFSGVLKPPTSCYSMGSPAVLRYELFISQPSNRWYSTDLKSQAWNISSYLQSIDTPMKIKSQVFWINFSLDHGSGWMG